MVGLIPDLTQICGQGWQCEGDRIYLLGIPLGTPSPLVTLGASEYLAAVHKTVAGRPPRVDFDLETSVQTACRHGIRQGWVRSAHDSAEGGVAVALAEACISGQRGAQFTVPNAASETQRWDELLFAEGGARIVVSVDPVHQADWETYLQRNLESAWQALGSVGAEGDRFEVKTADNLTLISASMEEIASPWLTAIETCLTAD